MSVDLADVKHLPVASAMKRVKYADVIVDLAAGDQQSWTLAEWTELLRKLDNCRDTVEDWLSFRSFLES
jgi:hypothetical protein